MDERENLAGEKNAANEERMSEHLKLANSLQEKIELYFVGLIFTILALGIQTSKLDGSALAVGSELLGWIFLILAGTLSIWRLMLLPQLMRFQVQLAQEVGIVQALTLELQNRDQRGVRYPPQQPGYEKLLSDLKTAEENIPVREEEERSKRRTITRFAVWSFFLFLVGLLSIGFSRAEVGIERLLQQKAAPACTAKSFQGIPSSSVPAPAPKTPDYVASKVVRAPQTISQP